MGEEDVDDDPDEVDEEVDCDRPRPLPCPWLELGGNVKCSPVMWLGNRPEAGEVDDEEGVWPLALLFDPVLPVENGEWGGSGEAGSSK